MVMPGETIALGAPAVCMDNDWHPGNPVTLQLEVLYSNAGHYVGTQCRYCGPYSRESGYFKNREDAEQALSSGEFGR